VQEQEQELVARALAEATATAISAVHVNCTAPAGGYACAEAGTSITDTAYAVGRVRSLQFIAQKCSLVVSTSAEWAPMGTTAGIFALGSSACAMSEYENCCSISEFSLPIT
jgi:hypothetical protein